MIYPKIDNLLEHVDSKYALVIAAAKRARQINDYHHQLGEGSFEGFAPPLVESRSKNFLTMALEEIAEGKLESSPPEVARPRSPPGDQGFTLADCRRSGGVHFVHDPRGRVRGRRGVQELSSSCGCWSRAGHEVQVVQTPSRRAVRRARPRSRRSPGGRC